ncbi:chemotaxis protein CheW, partial [Ferrovibrio sp.]|uniref:chemotaxis protein CheW n=2 Tax=Ferrovibrio sp. TaxID=1917215 RepID=UPI00311FC783
LPGREILAAKTGTANRDIAAMSKTDMSDTTREYLTFVVDGQDYGIDLLSVTEIRGWTAERPLPNSPAHVRGVINLRGLVIPIYDLRIRLGAEAVPPTVSNVVIVVQAAAGDFGLLVDSVSDILPVADRERQPVPPTAIAASDDFLAALVARDSRMVSLIDLDRLVDANSADAPNLLAA